MYIKILIKCITKLTDSMNDLFTTRTNLSLQKNKTLIEIRCLAYSQ